MKEPSTSIGLLTAEEIRLEFYGRFILREADKKVSGLATAKLLGAEIALIINSKETVFRKEITLIPDDFESETFLVHDVIIGKNFHWQKKENQRFKGTLKLITEKGKITAVNIISVEDYLRSVISSEMSPYGSPEFLKAHTVVSRGWLLAQLENKNINAVTESVSGTEIIRWYGRGEHTNYDFCADDHCQRYQGISKINNEAATHAIAATRGLILMYGGKICDTRYSKCCGGVTESFENIWEPHAHAYIRPVFDSKFEPNGDEFERIASQRHECQH